MKIENKIKICYGLFGTLTVLGVISLPIVAIGYVVAVYITVF